MAEIGGHAVVGKELEKEMHSILVIFAMAGESHPLVEHLALQRVTGTSFAPNSPWVAHSGTHSGFNVTVVTPGKDPKHECDNVGTVPSAVLTYAAVLEFKPDLIINAGTAGGVKARGASIGDVYLATHISNHDRRIPLPNFEAYGVGTVEGLTSPGLIKSLGLKEGRVSSGNSFDLTEADKKGMDANEAVVKDMECAGIAWVASTLSIPILAIKSVTDLVDGGRPSQEEFLENFATAAASLQRTVLLLIDYIGGKKLSEL
eukprot:TRINITY_DN472_c0_g7_i1.p1 TRINITY_DN472_c0_g7~~TRINITY_DN472_c0_g7_i1.p1  ORF type:complete len:260 (+),score=46.78 TRINITY_DN472_c0_g7_i1:260-1039(+)